ncbi:MAG TPA: hypothetical protein VF989_16230 [Polyangiaceae bacterium]
MKIKPAVAAFLVFGTAAAIAPASVAAVFDSARPAAGLQGLFGFGGLEELPAPEPAGESIATEHLPRLHTVVVVRLVKSCPDTGEINTKVGLREQLSSVAIDRIRDCLGGGTLGVLLSISDSVEVKPAFEGLLGVARHFRNQGEDALAGLVYAEIAHFSRNRSILAGVERAADDDRAVLEGKRGFWRASPLLMRHIWRAASEPSQLILGGIGLPRRVASLARGFAEARRASAAARVAVPALADIGTRAALARFRGADDPIEVAVIGHGTSALAQRLPMDFRPIASSAVSVLYKYYAGQGPYQAVGLRETGFTRTK